MKRPFLIFCALFISVNILILNSLISPTSDMILSMEPKTIMTMAPITTTQFDDETLLEEIQSYANEHNIEPIDATVDRVWKAIPGYNGLEVDVEASYLNILAGNDFDVEYLVYNEVSPEVHLNDLPPSPIYKGNPQKPMVALLINVAWGNEFIPQILETLKKHQVKATFFFDGSWVKNNPDLAKMIHKENHEIGNHAYSHPNLKHKSNNETMDELKKTNDVIESTLGIKTKWFAPPSGSFSQETINVARQLDMLTILWTVDTVDWRNPATLKW